MRFAIPFRKAADPDVRRDVAPDVVMVEIDGRALAVRVRRSKQARRLILRLEPRSGDPVVTVPGRLPIAEVRLFVDRHLDWLSRRLAARPPTLAFRPGAVLPLRGESCRIEHRDGGGLVSHWRESGVDKLSVLSVPGRIEHLPRRVTAWLKAEARRDLIAAADRHEAALGRNRSALRVGDARSRWGSCTARGVLTFSWRLVLAPPWVLDYLAAHEVAHLAEMNHGKRFWTHVARLCPGYRQAGAWLKTNGPRLQVIGRD